MLQRGRKSPALLSVISSQATAPSSDLPSPPDYLDPPEQELWRAILRDFSISPALLPLLAAGLCAHQRARDCRDQINKDGSVVRDRHNGLPRRHPLLSVEVAENKLFLQAFKMLGLKAERWL